MNTACLSDYYAVGVHYLVVRRRRRARATGTHGAAGRLAQRTDAVLCRVVDAFRVQNRALD